jgi:hypothetical protein
MNHAQNFDRGFGANPACAWIPLLSRFRRSDFLVAPASRRQFFERSNVAKIAGKMPALLNSPAIAVIILISIPLHDSSETSWNTIFAWAEEELEWRILWNHVLGKGL